MSVFCSLGTHCTSQPSTEDKDPPPFDKQPANAPLQEIAPPPPSSEPCPPVRQEVTVPVAQPSPSPGKPPPDKSSSSHPNLLLYDDEVRNMLLGRISVVKCKVKPMMIRIYVSASHDGNLSPNFYFKTYFCTLWSHSIESPLSYSQSDAIAALTLWIHKASSQLKSLSVNIFPEVEGCGHVKLLCLFCNPPASNVC